MHIIITPYICLALVRAPWRHHKSAVPSTNLFGPSGEVPRAGLSCPAGSGHCYSSSPWIPPSVSEWRSWEDELVVVNSIEQWFSSRCWVLEFFVRKTVFGGNVNGSAARLLPGEVGVKVGMRCASHGHGWWTIPVKVPMHTCVGAYVSEKS